MKLSSVVLILSLASLPLASNAADAIVFDQGPTKGVDLLEASPFYEGWRNVSSQQNLIDLVSFSQDTFVTGYNFFTHYDLTAQTASEAFHLKLLANVGNAPSDSIFTADLGFTSYSLSGNLYMYHFEFTPVRLSAGQSFWAGLSGNGFETAATTHDYGSKEVGYFLSGNTDFGTQAAGDLTFQLTGYTATPVPEPSTYAMMGAATLAGIGLFKRLRSKRSAA